MQSLLSLKKNHKSGEVTNTCRFKERKLKFRSVHKQNFFVVANFTQTFQRKPSWEWEPCPRMLFFLSEHDNVHARLIFNGADHTGGFVNDWKDIVEQSTIIQTSSDVFVVLMHTAFRFGVHVWALNHSEILDYKNAPKQKGSAFDYMTFQKRIDRLGKYNSQGKQTLKWFCGWTKKHLLEWDLNQQPPDWCAGTLPTELI